MCFAVACCGGGGGGGWGWPLGSRLWCLLWVCCFPVGVLGQVWYLIVSIPDLCTRTYFKTNFGTLRHFIKFVSVPLDFSAIFHLFILDIR